MHDKYTIEEIIEAMKKICPEAWDNDEDYS
jgi:alpha-galactosidase/6-phospho-beta-glucosidase family protein